MNSFNQFDTCVLCGSPHLVLLKGYEQNYLVKCSSCDFVFCQRKPTAEELKVHYGLYPRANAISEITLKRYSGLLDAFEPYRKTNNIIDVGCGDGFFLEVAKRRKWNVFGTEFTKEAIDVCEQKGIQMTVSPLNSNLYPSDFFDIITSFEVIEHLSPDKTLAYLRLAKSCLVPGGIFLLSTPNHEVVLKSGMPVPEFHINNLTSREVKNFS